MSLLTSLTDPIHQAKIAWGAISLVVGLTISGFGAYYDLKSDVRNLGTVQITHDKEIDEHKSDDRAEFDELKKTIRDNHKELLEGQQKLIDMLLVPPELRARKFSATGQQLPR